MMLSATTIKQRLFHSLFLGLYLLVNGKCLARLEAAVILPHGDFAYDPFLVKDPTERRAATRISNASHHVGSHFLDETIDPEFILLLTPHGIALTQDFGVYLGDKASGYADIGADLHQPNATYRVRLPTIALAPALASDLLHELSDANISGVKVSADESQDTPLQWAEVIPLLLVNGATTHPERQHLIWSMPLRRFGPQEATDMLNELLVLGQRLFDWMDRREERFAVLLSADLSHTHRPDGPYGYSPTSQPFDENVAEWAKSPCQNAKSLLVTATKLQPHALSCGYAGMVMLHGMICGHDGTLQESTLSLAETTRVQSVSPAKQEEWKFLVLVEQNVTYYGMIVATMQRTKQTINEDVEVS